MRFAAERSLWAGSLNRSWEDVYTIVRGCRGLAIPCEQLSSVPLSIRFPDQQAVSSLLIMRDECTIANVYDNERIFDTETGRRSRCRDLPFVRTYSPCVLSVKGVKVLCYIYYFANKFIFVIFFVPLCSLMVKIFIKCFGNSAITRQRSPFLYFRFPFILLPFETRIFDNNVP